MWTPRWLLALLVAVAFAAVPAHAQYQLVWSDEFDGTSLDLTKWEPQIGTGCPSLCGWGNNELQYYRAENATVSGGFLKITAKQEFFGGRAYTSARIRTKNQGDWERGRFEMRAKLPIGQGLWPAWWMLPTDEVYGTWAASGEIDMIEAIGQDPDRIFGTLHFGGQSPANTFTSAGDYTLPSGTFNDDFHIFALEWDECEMRWYVDGIQYGSLNAWWSSGGPYPAPFDQRFHMLLNIAVGGNLPGFPDGTTPFPQDMTVDYVRVYQKSAPDLTPCITLFDDMEHGSPFSNGWFSFGGTEGGGGISANSTDIPPADGCNLSLSSGWGGGGTPGFYGGFGRGLATDLTGATHFSFWINPDPGQDYTLEINLQEDDNGDGSIPGTPDGADDEFQYNLTVGPSGEVVSGGGWQYVSIPLSSFFDDNSYHFGGNGVFDPYPVSGGGNGELIASVWSIVSNGTDVTFRTDRWQFTRLASSVSGRVWEDTNLDGVEDGGEVGLNGVTVDLFDVELGAVVASTTTVGDGNYTFPDLLGGSFEVLVDSGTLPPGSVPTFDPDGTGSPHEFAQDLECDTAAGGSFGYGPDPTSVVATLGSDTLLQNVPNPFVERTTILFQLKDTQSVKLNVHDVAGRRVRTLLDAPRGAGVHRVEWDGRDELGQPAAAGVYFYTLQMGEERSVRKMSLLR